ncbi:MAG: lycopene cyclase domain-containing protein [Bacteroidota bacterium]|nr:lycopene cyclase domain-containing protein [Bacteroidota bacterium]
MKFLYLLVDFFTILVPFLFSFHPKIQFYKTWKEFFIASVSVAFIFIIWDSVFTSLHVWSFNPRYVTGIYFLKLPIEEILFFICIPFSCVFTFFCLDKFYNLAWNDKTERNFVIGFFIVLVSTGLFLGGRLYTSITLITTAFVAVFFKFIFRVKWFGKAISVYAILLVPFLIVNGILTGSGLAEPVVIYNKTEIMNIRLFTIPVEDVFYGLELFLLNLGLYKWLLNIKKVK